MSHILYILAVNYNRKHLENLKKGLENCWIFSSKRVGTLNMVGKKNGKKKFRWLYSRTDDMQ